MSPENRPLVLHVMYRFDTGGLENGIVNLINHMPAHAYRHAVLALTDVTDFRLRIRNPDVEFIALGKPPGQGVWQFPKLFKLFKQLRPDIVHSRNIAALEAQAPAWAAGVPVRLHGEHGRDLSELDGGNTTYQQVRRLYKPFVHHYTALSADLAIYLRDKVRVAPDAITQTCNGVDTERFHAARHGPQAISGCPFNPAQHWLVGTVGRMTGIKDQVMLAQAFVRSLAIAPELRHRMRLVMVGEGPLRAQAQAVLDAAGVGALAWLPGHRDDVADILRGLQAFALPSLGEGISNVILEAMASALPVVATAVGGNADLVVEGQTGRLVAAGDPDAMAHHMVVLACDPERAREMGQAGRQRALSQFSLQVMVSVYQSVYDQQLRRVGSRMAQQA